MPGEHVQTTAEAGRAERPDVGLKGRFHPGFAIRGPALWIAVGVVVGASTAGIALSISRIAPLPTLEPAATEAMRTSGGEEPAKPGRPVVLAARKINLNTASPSELERLPGIGPTMARRITEHRGRHGSFTTVDSLGRVRGIGPKTIERLRPLVTTEAD